MKTSVLIGGLIAVFLMTAGPAMAHTPLCSCYENGDGTVTCEGGFSDGSSASGVKIHVDDAKGNALIQGKMDKDSEFTFNKPTEAYKVVFDAGKGHAIKIDGKQIVE